MNILDLMDTEPEMKMPTTLDSDLDITGLSCDSRLVKPGYLFAAFDGANSDGATFIDEAIRGGAVAVLAQPGTVVKGAALIEHENPRRFFSQLAARFYPGQPETIVAVTGTNGKTSVAHFLRQLWADGGFEAAALGTLGVHGGGIDRVGKLTTPDAVAFHRILRQLSQAGVTHLAMEASSHGLAQHRIDGARICGAAFTNISRDHLDYHGNMENYLAAKMRLFSEVVADDGFVVLNAAAPQSETIAAVARQRGLKVMTYGTSGDTVKLLSCQPDGDGQALELEVKGRRHAIRLSLAGAFQADNALCAMTLAMASGMESEHALAGLETLEAVPGRLQKAGDRLGAHIYVDYAHTPDALKTVLEHLKPHARGRLIVVFGAGGDRDPGKRAEMGAIASQLADCTIVTDDNPRSEDPAAIRAEIMAAVTSGEEISPRADAIRAAVGAVRQGDILVVAGKGHEQGQIIGNTTLPFDDIAEVRAAIQEFENAETVRGAQA